MPEVYTGKIKRQWMANFIDSAVPGAAKPVYVRLGKNLEEYSVEMNANVESKNNIMGETSVTLDSYQPQAAVKPYYAVVGEAMFERLQKIVDERQTLDELNTSVVEVHLWEEDSAGGTFTAYKEDAIIEVSSYGGDTTGYQIPFNLHLTGNRIKGKFSLDTKTFTADTVTLQKGAGA